MCLDVFLAINILALEGSLPFFLDNYHPLKLYANAQAGCPSALASVGWRPFRHVQRSTWHGSEGPVVYITLP